MKGKLLKKAVAGISTLAMIGSVGLVPVSVSAATNLYTEDFEGKELTDLVYSLAGNTTARMLTNVADNETTFYNYYVDGGSGNRASTLTLSSDGYGANVPVKLSMKARIMGSNRDASVLEPHDTAGNALFNLTTTSYVGSTTINGEAVTLTTSKLGSGVLGASDYAATGWLQFEAIVDFRTSPSVVNLTVTDITNDAVVYEGRSTTNATNISAIYGSIGRANGAFAFDDIVIDQLDESELPAEAYTITYVVDGVTSEEFVDPGNKIAEVPETTKTGYVFVGWYKDDDTETVYTTEEIQAMDITASTTFTAVFEEDDDYIEPVASVEFSTLPSGGMLTAGPDADTSESNLIAVSITGELGTDLIANPDPRVNDFTVEYELKGFRWIASENRATSDLEDGNTYCDGYGNFIVDDETHTADFQLRRHFFNYYGQVVATVTYNGKTMTTSAPLAYLGDTSTSSSTDILPRGGYISDFSNYSPDMEGYIATVSADNRGATDIVTDNWAAYGGNNTRQLQLVSEDGNMFMRLTGTAGNSSCFAANQIQAVTDTQVVFDQKVRFYNAGSSILLKTDNPVTWSDDATSFSVNFTGTEINIDGQKIADATTGVWYRLVINSSVGSKQTYAMLYDANTNELLGQSEIASFTNAGSTNPTFYMFRVPDDATSGMIDFNDVRIYRATVDQDTYTVEAESPTLSIPEEGAQANTVSITANAKSTDGYDMISPVTWSIQDAPSGITITPNEDTHTAVLSVENGVSAGPLTVLATLNGITKSVEVLLTTSSDSISFLREHEGRTGLSPQSVSVPLNASETSVAEYKAVIVNKDFEIIDEDITYRLVDSNGNDVSAEGISFENGILTVTSEAKATNVWVEATGKNSAGETLVMRYRVVIHGLSFDFGEGTAEDVAEGYTSVTPTTGYNETQGYGIEGTVTVGGEGSTEDPTTDYFNGTFTFKANVEKNKIYKVTLNYAGNAEFENISTDLSGVLRQNKERQSITYETFVNDDVLDITFSDYVVRDKDGVITDQAPNAIASIEIEKVDDKTPGAKPNIYTVGDSTIANNGSWAYNLAGNIANYPELSNLATFTNNGRGGKNLSSYYTGGELWDRVVTKVRPGDYVMIGDMGTNGMGADFEGSLNYYIDACLTMGAKVILNSYSPHGAVGDYENAYNSETHTFNGWRQDSYDNIVREVYEERKSELTGFVEIGKNADAAFNAYVADYANNGYSSADEAAQAIIDCFDDHNHYHDLATTLMIEGYGDVPGIVDQLVDIITEDLADDEPSGEVTATAFDLAEGTATATVSNTTGSDASVTVYVAAYDANGMLVSVQLATKTVAADGTETFEVTNDSEAASYKAFVWNDANNVPLANAQ